MTSEERDRDVDAAWRAASAEEPPPQLDAAIRAEARRAVAAGPHDERRRRYRQLRYPFAAAATVALLAFGIAQISPPDQVAPDVVSDQPPASRSPSLEPQAPAPAQSEPTGSRQAQSQPANAPRASESDATIERPQSVAKDVHARKRDAAPEGERFAAAPSRQEPRPVEAPPPPVAQPPANAATAKLAQRPAMPAPAKPAPNTPMPEPANSGAANVMQGAPRSEPFPAAPPKIAAAENPPAPNAPQVAGSPPPPPRDMQAETAKREQAASAAPGTAARNRSAAPAPAEARASNLDELKAKQAGAESVEAWIARIRALRSSGDLAAAGRELAAFRDTFGDRADALLPRDLRGFTASDGKGQ